MANVLLVTCHQLQVKAAFIVALPPLPALCAEINEGINIKHLSHPAARSLCGRRYVLLSDLPTQPELSCFFHGPQPSESNHSSVTVTAVCSHFCMTMLK